MLDRLLDILVRFMLARSLRRKKPNPNQANRNPNLYVPLDPSLRPIPSSEIQTISDDELEELEDLTEGLQTIRRALNASFKNDPEMRAEVCRWYWETQLQIQEWREKHDRQADR